MTTSVYYGLNRPFGFMKNAQVTAASSSTSTTSVELRVDVVEQYNSGRRITKFEVLAALEALRRYILMGGSQLGTAGTAGQDNGVAEPIGAPAHGA